MIPQWTSHLADLDEKKRFKTYMFSSKGVLDRLLAIIATMETDLEDQELDKTAYDSPSWASKQADNNGYRRCLREIRKLLTLDPKDKNDKFV